MGLRDSEVTPEAVVDVAGRDPERGPMAWDASPSGGFTTSRPWLPAAEAPGIDVAAQRDDPRSMLAFYRDLLRRRRASTALRRGTYRSVEDAPADVFEYVREAPGERWLVVANLGDADQTVDVAAITARAVVRVSTNPDRQVDVTIGSTVVVRPDEGILIRA